MLLGCCDRCQSEHLLCTAEAGMVAVKKHGTLGVAYYSLFVTSLVTKAGVLNPASMQPRASAHYRPR
jgi:hypothetical protein